MINMEVKIVKGKIKHKDEKRVLNVAAYVRVSTSFESQKSSFEAQIEYYKNMIENNPNWNLIKIYSDYGISGRDILNRTKFLEMIMDALNGKINLILTKSISRFARNMEQFLKYIRMLKDRNIGIYFEEENINTLDMTSEFLVSILSLYAEQEAINYSYHIQKSVNMRLINREQKLSRAIYGYKLNKNKTGYLINKKDSEVVKMIYDMFLNQGYSVNNISKYLRGSNIPTPSRTGNWCFRKVKEILSDQTYTGDTVKYINKTNTYVDYKKLRRSKENAYIIENTHKAIIDKDTYFKVQDKLKDIKKNCFIDFDNLERDENRIFWSSKMRCGFCGSKLLGYKGRSPDYYGCVRLMNRKDCIDSRRIRLKFIQCAFLKCMNKYKKRINDEHYSQLKLQRDLNNLINDKNKIIDRLNRYANDYINKRINLDNYYSNKRILESKLNEINNKIIIQNNKIVDSKKILSKINTFNNEIDKYDFSSFDLDIFDKVISLVLVGGYKKNKSKTTYIRFIYNNKNKYEITDKPLKERIKLNGINIDNENLYCLLEFKIKKSSKLKGYDSRIWYDYFIRLEIPIVDMEDMIWK